MTNDLISREAVLDALRARGRKLLRLGTSFESNIASNTALECVNIVKDTPAVDAVPVVHGRWIKKPFLLGTTNVCDKCGEYYGMPHGMFNYCPNCGARMDREECMDAERDH